MTGRAIWDGIRFSSSTLAGEVKMKASKTALTLAMASAAVLIAGSALADPWKFGVMSDTQWTAATDPAGQNPNGVSLSIANQITSKFVAAGVKFVVQVGDLTENGNDADELVRAAAARPLYNAGIGFFPMRGNHELYASPANGYGIAAFQANYPQTRGLSQTFGASHFSSPIAVSVELDGLSYSFDYQNARFVIVDPWATPTRLLNAAGYSFGYSIAEQQPWISGRLDLNTRGTDHAFVFSHQPVMAENHQDTMFQGYTNANPDMQNAFFASLQNNDVKYYISGHDHMHQRSLVASPGGASLVQELICQSDSSKFYTPKALTDAKWYGQKVRETSLSQELYTVGYYIFTVDGPRVTVDYYSDDHGKWQSDSAYPNGAGLADTGTTPVFNFVKKETWGYSLNGHEFLVPQGAPYTVVADTFEGTTAQILDGVNGSSAADYTLRPLTKAVDTGWTHVDERLERRYFGPASDILTLWGMAGLGSAQTDTYVLSMSYDDKRVNLLDLLTGDFGIASRNADGKVVNTVSLNVGGQKKFVRGPWQPGYGLGTYGVDRKSKTAWAVLNHEGEFAVARAPAIAR
jgi:hypothetical protein